MREIPDEVSYQEDAIQSTFSRPQALYVTGIMDTCFRLYRKHFWTYLAIVMIIEVPALMMFDILLSINGIELITFQDFSHRSAGI